MDLKNWVCTFCSYSTSRNANYIRHLQTSLHKKYSILTQNTELDLPTLKNATVHNEFETEQSQRPFMFEDEGLHNDVEMSQESARSSTVTNESFSNNKEWFPFASKVEMMLYVLMNSATHPVSDEIVKFIMYILRESGIKNIPTFSRLKNMRFGDFSWEDMLEQGCDDNNTPVWIIKPSEILKLLIAHPEVSDSIQRYPVTSSEGTISHPACGEKWQKELEFPSASWKNKHFHKGRVYKTESSVMGQILKFQDNLETDTVEAVLSIIQTFDRSNMLVTNGPIPESGLVIKRQTEAVPLSLLYEIDIELDNEAFLQPSGDFYKYISDQERVQFIEAHNTIPERPVVSMPINLFLDDTSTNRSRRWLALHCVQMQLAGLPIANKQKQGNIFYVGASEKVDIMDISSHIVKNIQQYSRDGIPSFDAKLKVDCLVKPSIDVIVADYNILSHCCNHLGATAKKYCPRCFADVDHFTEIQASRTPAGTLRTIQRLDMRSTECRKKPLRTLTGVKEHSNCFWDILDPHKDIPIGMLHLLPLGLTKHLVQHILKSIDDNTKNKLSCHLSSLLPKKSFIDFFLYLDSRQGKDFKEYLQVAPFNMSYAGVLPKYVEMVTCLAEIQRKLDATSFKKTDVEQLQDDVAHYQDLIAEHAPSLKKKAKTHLLGHLVQDINRHGPPSAYNEDAFEKNHGNIRSQICLENQKARSRDTAITFAKQYLLQHVITGGFFKDEGQWRQSSNNELHEFRESNMVQKFLGLLQGDKRRQGAITKLTRSNNCHTVLESINAELVVAMAGVNVDVRPGSAVVKGCAVTTKSNKIANANDWIKYIDAMNNESYGMFQQGYIIDKRHMVCQILEAEIVAGNFLGCKKIRKTDRMSVIMSKNVLDKAEMVHDCGAGRCKVVKKKLSETVEHTQVSRTKQYIEHTNSHNIFLLNKYAI